MRNDPYQHRARQLCLEAGIDPDIRIGEGRGKPAWTDYRDAARKEHLAQEQEKLASEIVNLQPQKDEYKNSPIKIFGDHDEGTIAQMRNCMSVGNAVAGVICADGHLGYAQPVGGVIAYEDQISISGVGFDIGCGNMAVKLDLPYSDISNLHNIIAQDISRKISFGVGRTNSEKVQHSLFDNKDAWLKSDMEEYRTKAVSQLGTVGSGNHYVDLMYDGDGFVWIGVHFGSRGLGHTSATRYLKAAGGKDGMNVAPAIVDVNSELGLRYISAMQLAGEYSYAGREWVVKTIANMLGADVMETVHNHHNYAWQETHNGKNLWVVRKGATPAFPGQKGFIGGSMGDDAVIIEGVDSEEAKASLYSTVHGAGRLFGRKEAKRRFTKDEMNTWLKERGVTLIGADLDESPMAYRRLPDVLAYHSNSIKILHKLRPFIVVMAGDGEYDPWKD